MKSGYTDNVISLTEKVSMEDALIQLAEEAAELSAAAAKAARALRGLNQTPVFQSDAIRAVVEEYADTILSMDVAVMDRWIVLPTTGLVSEDMINSISFSKSERWLDRLIRAEKGAES